jgi:hypothetical protein
VPELDPLPDVHLGASMSSLSVAMAALPASTPPPAPALNPSPSKRASLPGVAKPKKEKRTTFLLLAPPGEDRSAEQSALTAAGFVHVTSVATAGEALAAFKVNMHLASL